MPMEGESAREFSIAYEQAGRRHRGLPGKVKGRAEREEISDGLRVRVEPIDPAVPSPASGSSRGRSICQGRRRWGREGRPFRRHRRRGRPDRLDRGYAGHRRDVEGEADQIPPRPAVRLGAAGSDPIGGDPVPDSRTIEVRRPGTRASSGRTRPPAWSGPSPTLLAPVARLRRASALKLVGDRHALSARQRDAVSRCACPTTPSPAASRPRRAGRHRGRDLAVDAFKSF